MIKTGVLKKTNIPYAVIGIDEYKYPICIIFKSEWERDYQIALDEIEEQEKKRNIEYEQDLKELKK